MRKIYSIEEKRGEFNYYDLYVINSGSFLIGKKTFRPCTSTWTDDEKVFNEDKNIELLVKEKTKEN